jgi:predicted DNA-binding transcriptional regulator AlpA
MKTVASESTTPKLAPVSNLLTPKEAARLLKMSTSFLAKKRLTGDGPAFIKIGRSVRYSESMLTAWTRSRQRQSTSESLKLF